MGMTQDNLYTQYLFIYLISKTVYISMSTNIREMKFVIKR